GRSTARGGTQRTNRAQEKLAFAILSGHRRVAPFGLLGGEPGQTGSNAVRRRSGAVEALQGCAHTVLEAGEAFIIVTPTGGGYGKP
ncbi:hydantoinase B/oxoprolinase family protein, partial [Mycobacterium tuberculosis]|nr:hydantoinase B/oxoprolinase family protein [Mycobacterium tuberculosis]